MSSVSTAGTPGVEGVDEACHRGQPGGACAACVSGPLRRPSMARPAADRKSDAAQASSAAADGSPIALAGMCSLATGLGAASPRRWSVVAGRLALVHRLRGRGPGAVLIQAICTALFPDLRGCLRPLTPSHGQVTMVVVNNSL